MNRMKELINILNEANKAYYDNNTEIMSNAEYDKLYDELVELEKMFYTVLSNSPTQKVGYEVSNKFEKEKHGTKMLSLNKTKSIDELQEWLGHQDGVLSLKLDGLTVVLIYENGILQKAITRGDGEVGEVVTNNIKCFSNVPLNIYYTGRLVIRGEAIIDYKQFEEINAELEEKYKNPRNLVSGTVRQLDPLIVKNRRPKFVAFDIVNDCGYNYYAQRLSYLESLGFDIVPFKVFRAQDLLNSYEELTNNEDYKNIPIDGLVLTYNDVKYGNSLGQTAKFPRNAIAFKWQDETADTILKEIEWSNSRTGVLTPVAIFDPVELEGTTISRASLHNVSIVKQLELNVGDIVSVYKANMIIPQILENKTKSLKSIDSILPVVCPSCGTGVVLKTSMDGIENIYCVNDECISKILGRFVHYCSRDALNIVGLSESTLEKFIKNGFLRELKDIYNLESYKDQIIALEGYGEKAYGNLINSIEKSKNASLDKFIYGLGIPMVGENTARLIALYFDNDLCNMTSNYRVIINGVGKVTMQEFVKYMDDNLDRVINLYQNLNVLKAEKITTDKLKNLNFVITGSLNIYENRDKIKDDIIANGGKVSDSVNAKTSYLINNDNLSGSSKNKKAKDLGIPIITEQDFINMIKQD